MSKLISIVIMSLSLIACGGGEHTEDNTPTTVVSPQAETANR